MIITDWIHVVAGFFILLSLTLGLWVSSYWFLLTAFVGANLLQFGFTGFCPLGLILKKLGVPEQ
ncbi:MAG: sulfurtransferase [Desulfobulbus propionicus]|nr:MAG: sulfurtransferase [Desulfobulbus propionicus]